MACNQCARSCPAFDGHSFFIIDHCAECVAHATAQFDSAARGIRHIRAVICDCGRRVFDHQAVQLHARAGADRQRDKEKKQGKCLDILNHHFDHAEQLRDSADKVQHRLQTP